MVSMIETSNSTHNDPAMDPVVPKPEPLAEGSISSAVSTPDPEGELLPQDVTQTQKRKGGRKPVRKKSFSLCLPFYMLVSIRGPAIFISAVINRCDYIVSSLIGCVPPYHHPFIVHPDWPFTCSLSHHPGLHLAPLSFLSCLLPHNLSSSFLFIFYYFLFYFFFLLL